MSAPVDISEKKRAMEDDSISQDVVEVKKRKLGREEEKEEEDVEAEKTNNGMEEEKEKDVDAEKMNNGREEVEEEDVESKKRNNGREEEAIQEEVVKVEKRSLGKAKQEKSSIVLVPGAELIFSDPEAFFASIYKDEEKPAPSKVEIPTLDRFTPPTVFRTRELIPIREPGSKAVLSAAKSLLGVSSSVGGEPLKRCSGFWIDWDEGSKTGTVLTTAHLIRTKDAPGGGDVWTDGAHYDSDANITVHLLDGTSAKGQLLYHQPHYDLAFLSVKVDQQVQLPSFNEGVKFSQKVFRLGRDKSSKLRITYGRAVYMNPDMYERYHNMYFNCGDCDSDDSDDDDDGDDDNECDDGGLVVDLDGEVVGMVNISETLGSFIPSSIFLKCVASWKNEGRILRPHLGMLFEAIKLLKPAYVDNIWRAYNIDAGLIVQEVSKGSHVEKIGIERGDIIESLNGRCISTTVQLENLLMSISKDPLDSQNGLKNEVNFSVGVFHALKKQRRTVLLNANVSDCGEVIVKEIMAPLKWPAPMMEYFVDECLKMVQDGRTPANENSFFQTLDRSMAKKSFDTTFSQMDLIDQFRRVRSLWDKYHEILKNLEIIKAQERQSQTDRDELRLKTGDIYGRKFTLIRKYETKLNTIFESFYEGKAKSHSTYRFNIEHSDRYSGDNSSSSKRRSLGEPFSRQIRLKSSDMPESSQNGSASEISEIQDYDKAMGELINEVDDGTYAIAGQCLRDPKILQSYSHIPTIERKISFLHGTWRLMCEPKCVLENLQPADQLFVRSPNS